MQCATGNVSSPVGTTPMPNQARNSRAKSSRALQDLLFCPCLATRFWIGQDGRLFFYSCRIDEWRQGKASPGCREPEDANRWAILRPTRWCANVVAKTLMPVGCPPCITKLEPNTKRSSRRRLMALLRQRWRWRRMRHGGCRAVCSGK